MIKLDSKALSQLVMREASKLNYRISDFAPNSFSSLMATARDLVIWAGASDRTIYSAPAVNWGFRAWHDSLHVELQAPFTLEGELYVARVQAARVQSSAVAEIIMAEVQGQAEYFATHGAFPEDQRAFIESYLNR